MAAFKIYADNEKENPCLPFGDKGKANNLAKQSINAGLTVGQQRVHLTALNNGNEKTKQDVVVNKVYAASKLETQTLSFNVYEDLEEDENLKELQVAVNKCEQKILTAIPEECYANITTPMSVVEAFSPMSVDRSMHMPEGSSVETKINDLAEHQLKLSAISASNATKDTNVSNSVANCPLTTRNRFFDMAEYQEDILQYFRETETKHRPRANYMRRQNDINYAMRTILVDWLAEVAEEYHMNTETLYLAVSYIDRFLSQMSVMRNKLQLVGTAAMYIASKYEEIYPPEVSDFVFITDDTFNKSQVLRMEQIMLKVLSFDLCTPTINSFINMYAVMTDMPEIVKILTLFIAELSLLGGEQYLVFLPSMMSAGALALARLTLKSAFWSPKLEKLTTYRLSELKDVILCLSKSHEDSTKIQLQAIQDKYKSEENLKVACIPPLQALTSEKFDELLREYESLTKPAQGQTHKSANKSRLDSEKSEQHKQENSKN